MHLFFVFGVRAKKIELLSFRKHRKAVAARVRAAQRQKEIATEDVLVKAKICCAETVVLVAQRINHVKTRVSCKHGKIVMIAFRASLKHIPVRNYSDNYFRAF